MKRSTIWFVVSFVFLIFSAPLGNFLFNIFFYNTDLTGIYHTMLNCTLFSCFLIGILMFIIGITKMIKHGDE